MGKIFTLTPDIIQLASDAIDDLINQLGKTCRLIYTPKYIDCVNCTFDPMGKKSSNRYLHGGPMKFPNGGICPVCNGAGRRAEAQSEKITMLINWNPSEYRPMEIDNVRTPAGMIRTKGYLSDLPKVERAIEMVLQVEIEGYTQFRFKLSGEPIDQGNIVQARYFVALWERIG